VNETDPRVSEPSGPLSRRQFLAGTGAVGAGAFLAACGGSGSASKNSTSTRAAALSSYGRSNGTLRFGMQTTIPGLDPHKWWNGAVACGTASIFEQLVNLDPYSNQIVPQLAAAMPTVTRGGTRYTFKLRPNVKFHNGQVLTSEDVKYSLERMLNPKFGAQAGSLYTLLPIKGLADLLNQKSQTISGIVTPDPQTVVFELTAPESTLLAMLSFGSSAIIPKAAAESMGFNKFNWNPIGTGPFKAQVIDRTSHIKLLRNESYWSPGIPQYAAVDWKIGISPSLSVLRIQSDQQDLMYEQPPEGVIPGLLANQQLRNQLVITPQANNLWFSLSTKVPELADPRVRQAIAMCIDKPRIVQALHGLAEVATGGFYPPGTAYYQPDIAYPYDPAKAKQLLAAAGHPNGFSVPMWSDQEDQYTIAAQIGQENMAAIGINAQYKRMSYDAFVEFTNPGPPGIICWAWGLSIPAGSYVVDSAFTGSAIKGGCCNYPHLDSASFDKLTVAAHQADTAGAVKLYKEMDKIITQDALWVTACYPKGVNLISSRVKNYKGYFWGGGDTPPFFYKYSLT
jgi:peptide/nickel transport system substrate-binding protein/oligopeptide transport system substrate-binding protein